METKSEKLSFRYKYGYGLGQMSDSIPYNMFSIYFLFFLTNVMGIPASIGGTISMIALLWDAVTDPMVGYLSDHSRSRYGRRRPYMLVSLVPLSIVMVLMFTKVNFGTTGNIVYFIFIAMVFRTVYTGYVIPYFSLGAEITQDYNERVTVQCIAGYVIYIAVWIITAGPMVIINFAMKHGMEYSTAWTIAAALFSLFSLLCGLISWRSLRGSEMMDKRDLHLEEAPGKSIAEVFKTYWTLLKDKVCIYVILLRLTYIFSGAIASAAFVYLMSVNLELGESQQALYWTIYSAIYIVDIAICNFLSNRMGKKLIMGITCVLGILVSIFFYLHNINSFGELILFTFLSSFSAAAFWTVGATMLYDYNEVVEFKTGKRQEGSVSGLILFAQKIGSAISVWVSGMVLSAVGYDGTAEVHSEAVKQGILFLNTLAPAIVSILSLICIIIYPINQKNFNLLRNALQLRNEGKEYSTEGFEKLI